MEQNEKEKPAFVQVKSTGGRVQIKWGFRTYKKWLGDKYTCYITAFDIYFSAKNQEVLNKKSVILTRMYINNYALLVNGGGLKTFLRQLNKLGFHAPNNAFVMKSVLKDKQFPSAKFKSSPHILPQSFNNADANEIVGELEMAF